MAPSKIITFDDGYETVFTKAYPYMKSKGIKGLCFVVVNWIGAPNRMNLNQLRELESEGWEIGSHTLSHSSLIHVDPNFARLEIVESKERLQGMGFRINAFAYPYGRFNTQIVEMVKKNYDWGRACYANEGSQWTTPLTDKLILFHGIDRPEFPCDTSFEDFKKGVDQWMTLV